MPDTLKHRYERIAAFAIAATILCAVAAASSVPTRAESEASPIYGVTIPPGFRDWEVVAVSQEAGDLNELRAILANPAAMRAFRSDKLPFPDGAIIAKVAWKRVASAVDDRALGPQAFVPGAASTRQFMVKDSKRYASSGGWGFGRFLNGKPTDAAQHGTCFACHASFVSGHDFVFTQYAP
jgi:hypothetical protein